MGYIALEEGADDEVVEEAADEADMLLPSSMRRTSSSAWASASSFHSALRLPILLTASSYPA